MTPDLEAQLETALATLPRVQLASIRPTPLEPLAKLSALLGGPDIYIKRDDLTGLAFGGNKSRYLEFTLAAARASGADAVVLSAVVHSNHCRQFAAAAARSCTAEAAAAPPSGSVAISRIDLRLHSPTSILATLADVGSSGSCSTAG